MSIRMRATSLAVAFCVVFGVAGVSSADDKSKQPTVNKLTAYVAPGASDKEAVVTLWMANVNPVGAICLPFKFAAADSFWLDSLVTKPYRAGSFQMMAPKYEKDKQTLLVNMLRDSDSVKTKSGLVPVGEGVLATLHFTAKSKFPLGEFRIAAVQLPPENVLLFVTETFNSVLPEFTVLRESPPISASSQKTP
ncbi:MAG: hypothetical protein ABL962_18695 [Fimbriimonadaceae bacterium]